MSLNPFHPQKVDIRINFPFFRVPFFLSEPFIHQAHLFFRYKRQSDRKHLGDDVDILFPASLVGHVLLGFFSIFFFLSLPRLLKWPLRWKFDESVISIFHRWATLQLPFPSQCFQIYSQTLSKPFQSLVCVSNCFHISVLMVSVELQFTPHWSKQW